MNTKVDPKIKSVYVFPNGNVVVFDIYGKQMSKYQAIPAEDIDQLLKIMPKQAKYYPQG